MANMTEEQFAALPKVRGGVGSSPCGRKLLRATDLPDGRPGRAEATRKGHAPNQGYRSKMELAYAGYLHLRMLAGEISLYRYEPFRLYLASKTTLTPDFLVVLPDGTLEMHEVKGWAREDAMVKLKIAARLYPWWKFLLVKRIMWNWEIRELPR